MDRSETLIATVGGTLAVLGGYALVSVRRGIRQCRAMDAQPGVTANCGGLLTDLSLYGSVLIGLLGLGLLALAVAAYRDEEGGFLGT